MCFTGQIIYHNLNSVQNMNLSVTIRDLLTEAAMFTLKVNGAILVMQVAMTFDLSLLNMK